MFVLLGIVIALVAIGAAILGFQDQRALWWRLRAGWYADPEANEPSDGAFAVQRVVFFVAAIALAFGSFQSFGAADTVSTSDGEVRDAAEQAARALANDPDGKLIVSGATDGFFRDYVEDALRKTDEGRENAALLTASKEETQRTVDQDRVEKIVEHYTVSDEGRHAVCMTVTAKRGREFTTLYDTKGVAPTYFWKLSATVAGGSC